MTGIRILGSGSRPGENRVSNEDLCRRVDSSDAWISQRTGIQARHLAGPDERVESLALEAAREALQAAAIEPQTVDLLVVATFSPAGRMPAVATTLAAELGLGEAVLAFDLNGACTGFVQALDCARNFLAVRPAGRRALVIGAEVISRWVDWSDRSTCVLFGDGAGAVLVESAPTPYFSMFGLRPLAEALSVQPDAQGKSRVRMDGQAVFRFALRQVPALIRDLAAAGGIRPEEVGTFILHQANGRILDKIAQHLALPADRFYRNIAELGNTSAASIPLALDAWHRERSLEAGEKVVLAGFGAGLTWGGILFEWS